MLRRVHRLLWRVKIGRCGPLSRALARALRLLLPVRGIGPLTNIVLGAPPAGTPSPAHRRIDGVDFELDLRQALHRAVYLNLFSLELRRVVVPLLREGDLFVDVGANFGFWALPAARRGCRVIAVEPVPQTRALLVANAERNDLQESVSIVAAALSDAPGRVSIAVPGGESGQASIHPDKGEDSASFEVDAVTLDELIGDQRVRFLKIDVEGHEPAVLRGATGVLRSGQIDYVLLELASGVMSRSGASAAALIDVLAGSGYVFVRFVRANEGLFPRRSYGHLTVQELRSGTHAGDALWARRH